VLLNETKELAAQKEVPHRDFYNCRKVTGSLIVASAHHPPAGTVLAHLTTGCAVEVCRKAPKFSDLVAEEIWPNEDIVAQILKEKVICELNVGSRRCGQKQIEG